MTRFRSTPSTAIRRSATWGAVLLMLAGGAWMVRAMLLDIRKSVAVPESRTLPDPDRAGGVKAETQPAATNRSADPPLALQRVQTDETAPPPEDAIPLVDPTTPPEPPALSTAALAARGRDIDLLLEAASKAAATGDQVLRRTKLNAALALLGDSPNGAEIRTTLAALNGSVFLGPDVLINDPYAPLLSIEAGDSFLKIARRHQITVDLLATLNPQLDSNHLRTGAGIKVVRGPFHLHVVKHELRADLYLRDLYVRSFAIQIADGYFLPIGTYRVRNQGKIRLVPAAEGRGWIVVGPGGGIGRGGGSGIGIHGVSPGFLRCRRGAGRRRASSKGGAGGSRRCPRSVRCGG
ncbi:MAG: LysM peptidoglycan-binding domain-containing protein [Phycisphaerae bacterium]